ncbi:MAG: hypothetical protein Q8R37_00605 [Nanoarchaeota archaeon]|nr:hypothetical protein [Nanoarchaeota archaeon]
MATIKLEGLVQSGMVKYFFHSPSSILPVRDVLNEQNYGCKTEPHIEKNAENYINPCYQSNIQRFAARDAKYLFLITTCRNKELEQYNQQLVVGYIIKENILPRPSPRGGTHLSVQGPTFLYDFSDSIVVKDIFGQSFTRPLLLSTSFVNEEKTAFILHSFTGKENIYDACVREIKRLKRKLKKS